MTRRSSPSSTAKVSDEGTAVIRHAKTELAKHEAQVEAEKENQDDTTSIVAMVVEQLARMYGYALIGCAYNVMYALGVSALPLTNWQGDGATAASASGAVPVVDRWAWGLFIGGLFGAVVYPLRCTFAIATGSPHTLPGKEIDSWDCALVCLVSMVLSCSANVGLTYFLPLAYGAYPEYYFLEVVPITLCFTLCVIITRRVMRAYLDSMQEGGKQDPRATGPRNGGQTTSVTQRKPNKQQHGSHAKKKIAAPSQQPRKEKEEEVEEESDEKTGIWAEISAMANMMMLGLIVFGCESIS